MDEATERVRALAEPVLAKAGAELVEVAVKRGRTQLVRLVVDRDGGIDLDACARISEEVSRLLDVDDPVAGRYTLEVTSPGLDRPLRSVRDFRRNVGRRIRVVLVDGQHEGTVEEVGEEMLALRTDGGRVEIPLDRIAVAKVLLPW